MNIRLLLITTFFLFGASSAHAQFFGWAGSITFTDGVDTFHFDSVAATYSDCEAKLRFQQTVYSPPTYSIVQKSPCAPLHNPGEIFIPEYDDLSFTLPSLICLSCSYMRDDLVELIYPGHGEKVLELVDRYHVIEFNQALEELTNQFDLEGFEKEMFLLEQELELGFQP